jgi:hypothetical protein
VTIPQSPDKTLFILSGMPSEITFSIQTLDKIKNILSRLQLAMVNSKVLGCILGDANGLSRVV